MFGKIENIVIICNVIWLVVKVYVTKYFDNHSHAYCVAPTVNLHAVQIVSLKYPYVLHDYFLSSQTDDRYIVLKYGLDFY